MSYDRVVQRRAPASDDCTGRALWALGTAAQLARDEGSACWRDRCSSAASPHATELGPRGTALTMLGTDGVPRPPPEVGPAGSSWRGWPIGCAARYRNDATHGLALVRADA